MLGAGVIDHLIIASNEQFLTNRVNSAIFVLIFCDNLDINARNLGQLNSTEDETTLGGSYESFSGLGEHHFGAMDVTLVAVLVLQNTVLQALQSNGLAHIALAVVIVLGDNFNTGRRNIEGNLSTLNNQDLAIYISIFGVLNHITFGISHFTSALGSLIGLVYTSQKILVGTQSVTLDNLSHLAGIQGERYGAAHIDLTTDMNIFGEVICGAGLRMLIALHGVLQNSIPVLGSGYEQIDSIVITALNEALALGVKTNQLIRVGQTGLGRAYPAYDMTLGFVKDIRIFIDG